MENQIEQIVNTLSEKLGKPIEHIWEVAVQGKRIEGIIDLVLVSGFVIINYFVYQETNKQLSKIDNYDDGDRRTMKAIVMIFSFVVSFILIVILSEIAAEIIIPEYCVIRDIIQ